MILNVPFVDGVVREFFSLHHLTSVEVAVYKILTEALEVLRSKVSALEAESEAPEGQCDALNIDALFACDDFERLLGEMPEIHRIRDMIMSDAKFPSLAAWFVHAGVTKFLEKQDKPYVRATARGFGINKSSTVRVPHEALIHFIAQIILDETFHTEPPQPPSPVKGPEAAVMKSPVPASAKKSPKPKTPAKTVSTPAKNTSTPKSAKKQAKSPQAVAPNPDESVRENVRVALFSDTPLKRSRAEPKRPAARQQKVAKVQRKAKGKGTPQKKKGQAAALPDEPEGVDTRGVAPTKEEVEPFDSHKALIAACTLRKIPLEWIDTLPEEWAWKMVLNPGKLSVEHINAYRIPIGKGTSAWQLQQWFYAHELQKFISDEKIRPQKKKKSHIIQAIVRHVEGATESIPVEGTTESIPVEGTESTFSERSMDSIPVSLDVLASQSIEPDDHVKEVRMEDTQSLDTTICEY